MEFTEQIKSSLVLNGYEKKIACDLEKEFEMIKNKKNFTVAVRIKPEFNALASNLVNL